MKLSYFLLPLLLHATCAWSDDAKVNKEVSEVKKAVLELNQELYQLEKDLLSPATTQVAFYLSLANGKYFEPLALDIKAGDLPAIRHIYTERQIQALRMGAVQPIASDNLGPGKHSVEVTLRGKDGQGQEQTLSLRSEVEKSAAPLMLEVVVRDDSNSKQATASLRVW